MNTKIIYRRKYKMGCGCCAKKNTCEKAVEKKKQDKKKND